jgi:hypothetical protein
MRFMNTRLLLILAASVTALGVLASAAQASCLQMTAAQQRARADTIFEGVALQGPTATGIQRFRVTRYLKGQGHGQRFVWVSTGNIKRADGSGSITSVSIDVKRGERWRIFAQGKPPRVLKTTLCDGSRKL